MIKKDRRLAVFHFESFRYSLTAVSTTKMAQPHAQQRRTYFGQKVRDGQDHPNAGDLGNDDTQMVQDHQGYDQSGGVDGATCFYSKNRLRSVQ